MTKAHSPSWHNVKAWFCSICRDFHDACGNLQERIRHKQAIMEACKLLNISWEQARTWFRETVGAMETKAKIELEKKYGNISSVLI